MNILDLLRGGPAAVGSQITGLPAAPGALPTFATGATPPMAAPQAAPTASDSPAPQGNVLAVIDPSRLQKPAEDRGMLGEISDTLTGGGLTADGKGRSKGGAFAHGLSTALNAQGARREKTMEREAKKAETALDRLFKLREIENRETATAQTGEYYRGLLGNAKRRQDYAESPDTDATTPGGGAAGMAPLHAEVRWRGQRARELGITGAGADMLAPARRAELLQQLETEAANPARPWNAARTAAPTAGAPAVPAPAGAPAPAAAPAPAVAPAPAASAAPPRAAQNVDGEAALAAARNAIASGAPKDKVIERLRGLGVSTEGL